MHDTYRIRARKTRTGELVEGTTRWDGLASLHYVDQADGTTGYVSVLDAIEVFEMMTPEQVEHYEGLVAER